jgi:hypothetical protein
MSHNTPPSFFAKIPVETSGPANFNKCIIKVTQQVVFVGIYIIGIDGIMVELELLDTIS